MRLGIVSWSELWNHTISARSFMPGVSAMAVKVGAIIVGEIMSRRFHSMTFRTDLLRIGMAALRVAAFGCADKRSDRD